MDSFGKEAPLLLTRRGIGSRQRNTLAKCGILRYNTPMSDIGWNSVTVGEDEKPQVSVEDLREMMADLDPEDFDESVQMFLEELAQTNDVSELKQAATLLLQDEVDFAPEMAEQGIEPDEGFIALLIAAGADVNAKNAYGQAPLHIAAKYGYTRIAEMLMMAGARKTLHDAQGRMPYELASQPDMLAMIQPSMADGEIPLPPEIEDADYVPEDEHVCICGHHHESGHECHCHHEHGNHDCSCGCHDDK